MLKYGSVILILCYSCANQMYFHEFLDRKNDVIAVCPFTGSNVSRTISNFAADELNRILFINKNLSVVDRSQVNYLIKSMVLENPYYLSRRDIRSFADSLQVNVIVLGNIEYHPLNRYEISGKYFISITLRFIDVNSFAVSGMIYDEIRISGNINEALSLLLEKMINKI